MSKERKNTRFKFTRRFSDEPISKAEWENLEDLLARLIAQAYVDDHPELFAIGTGSHESEQIDNLNKQGDKDDKTVIITRNEESEVA